MSLRKKTLISITFSLLLMLAVLFVYSNKVISKGFNALEIRDAKQNIERVEDTIAAEVETLTVKMADWAAWDDCYKYVKDHNKEFAKSNLNAATMGNMKLHQVSFWDTNRKLVYGKNIDLDHESALSDLTAEDVAVFERNNYFHQFRSTEDRKSGMIVMKDGPYLLSVLPITTSEGKGPIAGSLVSLRKMNARFYEKIAKITHVSVNDFMLANPSQTPDFVEANLKLQDADSVFIKTLSENSIAGYGTLYDVFDKRFALVRMETPREVHAQGESTIWVFMVAMALGGLVLIGVVVAILAGPILSKVSAFSKKIRLIENSGDLSLRLQEEGQDEISKLGHSVNNMLSVIEKSKRQITLLLDNTGQGFFSFDRNGIVAQESSKSVATMFGMDPGGKTLATLLGADSEEWQNYIAILFNEKMPFKDLAFLCPSQVSVNVAGIPRVLDLQYRPLRGGHNQLEQVLVIATDVTEVKALETQNQEQQERNLAIIKVLSAKNDFIHLMEMAENLEKVFSDVHEFRRHLHSLKGGFAFLECRSISACCHEWEEQLSKSTNHVLAKSLCQEAAQKVRVSIMAFVEENAQLLQINTHQGRIVSIGFDQMLSVIQHFMTLQLSPTLVRSLESLLERKPEEAFSFVNCAWSRTAQSLGKRVNPITWSSDSVSIIPEVYSDLFDTLVHIARNAADHGIEQPENRLLVGKSAEGKLSASLELKNDTYYLRFQDDGAGANLDKIKAKAQKMGLNMPASESEVLDLLFEDGITTKNEVSEFSGRGIGLDAVRTEARRLGGDTKAENVANGGLLITIWFSRRSLLDLLPQNSHSLRLVA